MSMNPNLFAAFEALALEAGEAPMLDTEVGTVLSYAQMLDLTARYANLLNRLGVGAGQRIAVQVDKSAENLCLYLAALRVGAIYLPLNPAYQAGELAYFLADAEARLFVCAPAEHAAKSALAARHGVAHTLSLDQDGGGTLSELAAAEAGHYATAVVAADAVAVILYTSGTTGRPKGAMLSHANLLSNGLALTRLWQFGSADVLLHALPLFHAHGLLIACHCALLSKSRLLFLKKFQAGQVAALLPRATVMVGVPTFYTRLLDVPDWRADHMRLFISGSAPLLADTSHAFLRRTGHVLLERYGMSEAAIISSNPCAGERRIGSVGPALDGVELRIADAADRPLPCGAVGAIQIRGEGVMQGYWRQPALTAAEFCADGWFRTGDLGTLAPDGYLSIVGRARDMVISGACNVYPKEVEMAIDALPGVLESAVIGVPDRDLGEAVTAIVVCRGTPLQPQAVIAALKTVLANYKIPKHVHLVVALPRNAMGKVQKNVLRDTYGKPATTNFASK
ncbi:malonyl-CoA/methylmalonyl-CoA synthetase [Oxalobacteraceae bacterium GrIS 1.11]